MNVRLLVRNLQLIKLNILKQENQHESSQNQAKEKKTEEQAQLFQEIEALRLKLSLMPKQDDREKSDRRAQIAATYNRISVTPPSSLLFMECRP